MKKLFIFRRALLAALTLTMSIPIWADQGYAVLTNNGNDVVIVEGTGTNAHNVNHPGEGKTLTFYYGTPTGAAGTDFFNTDNTGDDPGWLSENQYVTEVIFDASYDDARPRNCRKWFYDCRNLTNITDIEYLHTDNVVSMLGMFSNCQNLNSLDVTGFNTSNVIQMSNMFSNCKSLTTLDITGFITSSVRDMSYMFSGCSGLSQLDVTNFDTSNVTNMGYMFGYCSSLSQLDVTHFITDNVTTMHNMFLYCISLSELDVTNFNTANVTNMQSMFNTCSSLTELDVTNFITDNVTNMASMFGNCSGLSQLDVTHFNTAKVTYMQNMFNGCKNLTQLDVTNFNTANVTNMAYMFNSCNSLPELDVTNFNTDKVTNMQNMFGGCKTLTQLDVTNFNTANVTSMAYMFSTCTGLLSLDVSNFVTSKVTNMQGMFNYCNKLTEIDLSNFETSNVTNMQRMFYCANLLTNINLDTTKFNTSKVTDMASMFAGCPSLTGLDVSGFNTKKVTNMSSMFYGCYSLTSLTFGSDFSTESVQTYHKTSDTDAMAKYDGCLQMWSMFSSNIKLRYVDFYDSEDADAITAFDRNDETNMFYNIPRTTVVYLPKSSREVTDAANVVYSQDPGGGSHGGGAVNYILRCPEYYSENKVDIEFPRDFKTNKATYTRIMGNSYGSAILPYAFTSNDNIQAYRQDKEYTDIMYFKDAETVPAHTPFAFKKLTNNGNADFTMTDDDNSFGITVKATHSTMVDEDTWTGEKGAPYEDTTSNINQDSNLSGWSTKGYYISQTLNSNISGPFFYIASDKFKSANGNVTLPPHRVTFHNANLSGDGAKTFDIMVDYGDKELISAIETAETKHVLREAESIFDMQGRKIGALQRGVNIIRMNDGRTKKVVVK